MDDRTGTDKNGTIEVRGGQIIVANPLGSGKAAVISCGRGVKIFLNDIELKGSTTVFKESNIRVKVEDKQPERKLEVSLSEDNYAAYVTIEYRDGEKFELKDKVVSNEATVEVQACGILECPKYTIEEAKSILMGKGVVFGIIEEKLQDAVNNGSDAPVEIARGVEPIDASDDRIEAKFDDNKKLEEIKDRVDFYSIGKVVSVEPGMLIAEKIAGSEGSPGTDVLGNKIKQKAGKKLTLKAGRGARLSHDGLNAYSEILGRPELRGDIASVHEVYEVHSDVTVATGNIEFIGDVIIKGSIAEGMKVKAGNSVVVYGSVSNGEIVAGGDVTVYKNIISSKVRAGCSDFIRYSIIDLFEIIEKELSGIFSAVGTLKETGKVPKTYKDGQIIKLLVDTKFNHLTSKINELRDVLTDHKDCVDMGTIKVGATMIKYFTGKGPTLIDNYFTLKNFTEMLVKQVEELKGQLREPANICASYVQSSELTTSGDIRIEGKGCYTSELFCKGNIIVEKRGSVTRGGSINAGGEIRIYELGSAGGALTTVSAGKESSIYCEIAHVNSVIKIGELSNKLEVSYKKLRAYRYKGELLIEKSKM